MNAVEVGRHLWRNFPDDGKLARWALRKLPFQAIVGPASRPTEFIPAVSTEPAPCPPEVFAFGVKCVASGGTLLIISDRRDLCDQTAREVALLAGPAGGRA